MHFGKIADMLWLSQVFENVNIADTLESSFFALGQNDRSTKFQDSTDEADSWLLRDDLFTQSLVGR